MLMIYISLHKPFPPHLALGHGISSGAVVIQTEEAVVLPDPIKFYI